MENQTEKQVEKIGNEVAKTVETMKSQGMKNVKADIKQTAAKTKGTPKSKADELQQEIDRKTEELQKCLVELERKKQLSNNRTAFIRALDRLEEAAEKLNEETDFETSLYKLRFGDATSYGNNEIFSISNTFILNEFIKFMREKIQIRISEIEQRLITE